MLGPGKYDDACVAAREMTGGSCLLIVLDGKRGPGFSAQVALPDLVKVPDVLRIVADQMQADIVNIIAEAALTDGTDQETD